MRWETFRKKWDFFVCLSVLFLELTCSCLLRTRIGGWGEQILWFYSEGWSARQDMTGEKSTVWRPKMNLQWMPSNREATCFSLVILPCLWEWGIKHKYIIKNFITVYWLCRVIGSTVIFLFKHVMYFHHILPSCTLFSSLTPPTGLHPLPKQIRSSFHVKASTQLQCLGHWWYMTVFSILVTSIF